MTTRWLIVVIAMCALPPAFAYSPPKPIPDGWFGVVQFGAMATTGKTRTRSVNSAVKLSHKRDRWENQLDAKYLKSDSSIVREQKDSDGNPVLGDNGKPLREIIKGNSTNRFFVAWQPRWYWQDTSYLFTKLDWETNKPGDIDSSTRQIVGIGHKFWRSNLDYFAAEIGAGNKRLEQVSGSITRGSIAYLGLKFVHKLSDRTDFTAELDSDFGSDNNFTELELNVRYRMTERLAFKVKYINRMNSGIDDPANPLDSDVDSETTINLEIDIF